MVSSINRVLTSNAGTLTAPDTASPKRNEGKRTQAKHS
jgi:hypothetical protein